jgi:adenylyltransferase/sulfurtransferase
MSVNVRIPTVLRRYTGNRALVPVAGATVDEALADLVRQCPELRPHLLDEAGALRHFVNVFLNGDNLRDLPDARRALAEGDELRIVPAVAGGAGTLTPREVRRYSRHVIIPEVGLAGQERLKASSVLLIGTGGLGSPLALYLAAAGVGRLGLVDFDVVDETNLQRQILHTTRDVGRSKLDSAREKIQAVNPFVEIDTHETRLAADNALDILRDYDVVVDGTDNFPTRYLVNDACVLLGKPNVYGSIYRFEGQASVFDARRGPCYRCLYPEPPPPGLVPSCAEGGVLGILPGIIGTIQANETVKLLLGIGNPLVGRLLLFDALDMEFREVRLRKDPGCPLCGERPVIRELVDYEAFCGVRAADALPAVPEIEVRELAAVRDAVLLIDVREPFEAEIARIPGAWLIPQGELPRRLPELDRQADIVVHCKSGVRSAWATKLLLDSGFTRVRNLKGGILAWAEQVDPSVLTY